MRTTDFLQMSHAQCAMKAADMAWEIITLTAERDALAKENKRLREALCDFYSAWVVGRNSVAVSAIETARPLYEQALATVKEKPWK